jgi:hypothetical protein
MKPVAAVALLLLSQIGKADFGVQEDVLETLTDVCDGNTELSNFDCPTFSCTGTKNPTRNPIAIAPPEGDTWENVAIVRANGPSISFTATTKFLLYLPPGFAVPPAATLHRLRSVLDENPRVDAVGANALSHGTIMPQCHNIEICHWTVLLHFEYSCSVGPFMQCDMTSPVFMTQAQHAPLLAESAGMGAALAQLDIFVHFKRNGALVLTDTSVQIDWVGAHRPVNLVLAAEHTATAVQRLNFVRRHGVDEIRDRDSHHATALCTPQTCDAGIVGEILGGKSWEGQGISMPTFAYKAYVKIFQSAVRFLNTKNVTYIVHGGVELGLFKFGRFLPWDAGDVDIVVDVEQFGCTRWVAMVKAWANEQGWIHPHTNPAGARCEHYGVYAMPKIQENGVATKVQDPFSIGLLTFSDKHVVHDRRLTPWSIVHLHGVPARVLTNQWVELQNYSSVGRGYKSSLLQYRNHGNQKQKCLVKAAYQHNCIVDVAGTNLDTCMEYTEFGMSSVMASSAEEEEAEWGGLQ